MKPGHRSTRLLVLAAALYIIIRTAGMSGLLSPYWQMITDQALITIIGALGLSLIYGFTGQFSLGHAAFYGLGAYTAAAFDKAYGHGSFFLFLVALALGMVIAGLMALLIGLPILRLRSDYLGIATLGFGIIIKVALDNSSKFAPILGGATGMTGTPQLANFDIIFAFAVLAVIFTRNLIFSKYGRSFTAIREDEIAADVMGVDTTRYKVLAFVIGCMLAGLAGGLYAHRYPFLHPSSFDFLKSFDFLLIVVLGGLGSLTGTIITAVGWVFLLEGLRFVLGQDFIEWRGVIYALILIVAIILRPQGIFGGREWSYLVPVIKRMHTAKGEVGSGSSGS